MVLSNTSQQVTYSGSPSNSVGLTVATGVRDRRPPLTWCCQDRSDERGASPWEGAWANGRHGVHMGRTRQGHVMGLSESPLTRCPAAASGQRPHLLQPGVRAHLRAPTGT